MVVVAVLLLVTVNALFVAAEFGLVAVRPTRLTQLAAEGRPAARFLAEVRDDESRQSRYLATTQLAISAVSLALGMYGEAAVAERLEPLLAYLGPWSGAASHGAAVGLAIVVLTCIHIVLGEMVPKAIALRHPEPVVLAVARPVQWLERLMSPATAALTAVGTLLVRLLRTTSPAQDRILSAEELAMLISESASGGLIPRGEQQILLNVFDFAERQACQTMTPRTRMVAYPVDIAEEDLARKLASSRHTRFPIYDSDLDHIVGTLHLKDFIRWRLDRTGPLDLRRLARPARMVPEHMPAKELLEIFRRERGHMAIVIDEYGGTAGLVTLEDVAEELVGELKDEFDVESPLVEALGSGRLRVRGDLLLADLAGYVDLPGDLPEVETVGGLVLTALGRPPRVGDEIRLGRWMLAVQAVRGLAVEAVRISAADGITAADELRLADSARPPGRS